MYSLFISTKIEYGLINIVAISPNLLQAIQGCQLTYLNASPGYLVPFRHHKYPKLCRLILRDFSLFLRHTYISGKLRYIVSLSIIGFHRR